MSDQVIYAIGDVHGEADRYRQLVDYIFERHAVFYAGQSIKIVQLGDLVDRGPDSCGAVTLAMGFERSGQAPFVHLRGNHEQMMLDAFAEEAGSATEFWLSNGGAETMASYQRAGLDSVLTEHLDWLNGLETLHTDAAQKLIFVHAGIDVETFPHCREAVRLWTRSPRFFKSDDWDNQVLDGWRVIHGHTPTDIFMPEIDGALGQRINIDTGAVFGGRLTAAVFAPGEDVRFLYA